MHRKHMILIAATSAFMFSGGVWAKPQLTPERAAAMVDAEFI